MVWGDKIKIMEKDYIWKIQHDPTGLFYCSRKGRWLHTTTNLSKKGNHYMSEKTAVNVLNKDCHRASINKPQTEKYNLAIKEGCYFFNEAELNDFKIVKYSLELSV